MGEGNQTKEVGFHLNSGSETREWRGAVERLQGWRPSSTS